MAKHLSRYELLSYKFIIQIAAGINFQIAERVLRNLLRVCRRFMRLWTYLLNRAYITELKAHGFRYAV